MKYVKVQINKAAINRIKNRTKAELQGWANDVLRRKVEPVTPIDTGELRQSADVLVEAGDDIKVEWYWTAPHAPIVEDAWGGRYSPRTPGTIAPFAVPTIEKVVRDEIDKPVRRGFGG